jgi:hypothetical protein
MRQLAQVLVSTPCCYVDLRLDGKPRVLMRFETFEEVTALSLPELRELLARGDTTERIWAAWAYAMQCGVDSVPELAEAAKDGPPSGLRSHLIVILAGYGEKEIIRAFADSDPNPQVRATACLFLLQAFLADNADTGAFLSSVLRADPASTVRLVILTNAKVNGLRISPVQLVELAADPEAEIRTSALSIIADNGFGEEAIENGLIDCLGNETVPDLLRKIAAICTEAGRSREVLENAKGRRTEVQLVLLDFLTSRGVRFDWADLEGFAEPSDDVLAVRIAGLATESTWPQMFPWLAARLAAMIKDGQWPQWKAMAWSIFTQLLFKQVPVQLTEQTIEYLRRVLANVREQIADYEAEIDPDDPDWPDEYDELYPKDFVETLRKTEAGIQRLVDSVRA